MRFLSLIILGGGLALSAARPSQAIVLYDNGPDLSAGQNGDCAYNTTCGPAIESGSTTTYLAQQFTFISGETVNQIDWNAIVTGSTATSANWAFYADNSGTPGALVASGSSLSLAAAAGPDGSESSTTEYTITIDPVTLDAGTYYVALQADTTNFFDMLAQGVAATGSFETTDGGTTWIGSGPPGDLGDTSFAVTLEYVTTPEPASLAMFGVGLVGLCALRRHRDC
jgi:PEP-CTERM motif